MCALYEHKGSEYSQKREPAGRVAIYLLTPPQELKQRNTLGDYFERDLMHLRFAILCYLLCLAASEVQNPPPSANEGAIRDIVNKYVEAREKIDPKGVEVLFTNDADQLVSSGEWRRGRDAVVRGTMESSRRNEGKRSITVESIRFVSDDVAIVDARYDITSLAGGASRNMWTTFVMKRAGNSWRIAAIRNMLPAAPSTGR